VDALLATGVSRLILRAILREVHHRRRSTDLSPCKLISMNGITGMNYDTGRFDPVAVPVDLTITFHAPKRGHYCFLAAQACGELVVTSIGIEHSIAEDWRAGAQCADVRLADEALVHARLLARRRDAYNGRVLVISGCSEYLGAPALAARIASARGWWRWQCQMQ